MKSFRWTLVFALLVAALTAFAIYDYKRAAKQEEAKETALSIVRIKPDDMSRVELITKSGSTVLEKKGQEWALTSPIQDVAETTTVLSFLSSLEMEKSKETAASGEEEGFSLATYGLDHPVTRIKISAKNGQTEEIKIGSVKAYDGSLYGQIEGEKKVLLLGSGWDVLLSKTANDLRDKRLVRRETGEIGFIEIKQTDKGYPPLLQLKKVDGNWQLEGKSEEPISSDIVSAFIAQVKDVKATKFLAEDKTQARESHGLSHPVLVIKMGADAKDSALEIRAAKTTSHGTAEIATEIAAESQEMQALVALNAETLAALRKQPEDFFDREFPFKFDTAQVARLKIETASIKTELVKNGESWQLADRGDKTVDSGKVNELVGKISQLQVLDFLQPIKKGQATPKLKAESRIVLQKKDGASLLDISWAGGEPLNVDEAPYRQVLSDRANRVLGVSDLLLKDLEKSLGNDGILK